jgi:glycerophosphoryl diester phosphodiesterase
MPKITAAAVVLMLAAASTGAASHAIAKPIPYSTATAAGEPSAPDVQGRLIGYSDVARTVAPAAAKVELVGRAVLPVETYAPGPVSGAFLPAGVTNGISFPLPSQPVQGISSIVDGRAPGEYLAMPDNGYGAKATSKDFLIRAYYLRPDFKTANSGTGAVAVGDFIQFSDPNGVIGFPIVNEGTSDRLLTGGDIDPESLQRAHNGDLWVGDEFGPWILHFDAHGTLLDRPFEIPGVRSPNNPWLNAQPNTHPNSRGFEGMAITPDGRYLYAVLEGAALADPDQQRRHVYEFSVTDEALTGRTWQYRTSQPGYMVADMAAVDQHRLVLIERDGGLGATALFRHINLVDLRDVDAAGFLTSSLVVDLTAVPDPELISLPAIHAGDIGLGDPFRVVCESVEAVHPIDGDRLLIGCDNNFPNKGRNPGLADDSEFIIVKVTGLRVAL